MNRQDISHGEGGLGRQAPYRRRAWQLAIWLLLLMLVVTPVGAAPLRDDPVPPGPAQSQTTNFQAKVSTSVLQATANGQSTSFVIFLNDQADVSAAYNMTDQDARGWYVYNTLMEHAARTQAPVIDQLAAAGVSYAPFWAANMIVANGGRSVVDAMAARSDVKVIESNAVIDGIQGEDTPESTDEGDAANAVESGINQTNAPSLWTLGFNGQGIVVGNQDTGMRWTQAALRTHYRGWGGSVATSDHNYNWWDAIHVQITNADGGTGSPVTNPCGRNITAPCDDQGHGTHTTGTTVGDDAGAGIGTGTNQVGVAPGAKWIGCRNMDSGNGRASTYTECFQFFIAPTDLNGQNPDPAKRPHVMNNSWGCPLSGELCARTVLKTITENAQAAGIFVVASAGNNGSACSTVLDPPGIYDVAFSVGSFTSANALSSFSSRGPVTSDGSGRMKPDLSARGQSVRSSYYSSDTSYASMSGTSMASPHVVGTVAVLWSARPNLVRDIPRTKWLLTRSANPSVTVPNNASGCGGISSVPNNHFGWGRVDALAAYNLEPSLNQTITFDAISDKTYGDADFNVSASASSGLAVSFSASGNCSATGNTVHITGAGACTVTASQAGLDVYGIATSAPKPWYPAPNVSRTFSIAKAMLTVAADNQTKILNAPDPVFTFQITGFKNGETAAVLTTQPTCTSAATQTSPVGMYTITCSGGAADNYDFTYVNGTLTILYVFTGFYQPIDNLPALNAANSGQAIPLKWRITDVNGNPVTSLASVNVTALSLPCSLGTTVDQVEEYAPGASGLLNQGDGYYQFNWKTPKTYAQSCKTMKLDLGEGPGMERTALFQFPK
jgi:serine protease AprX